VQHLGGRKVSRVAGQVQGKNGQEPKKKKSTMVSNKKKMDCDEPHLAPNEKLHPI